MKNYLPIILSILIFQLNSCRAQNNKQSKPSNYIDLKKQIIADQKQYSIAYQNTDSSKKDSIINEARRYLELNMRDSIFPHWYGTEWDFNGTTQKPKEGKIACGYFVTTTIRDLGFDIPRIKWAQMASEPVIKKLSKKQIKRFYKKPIKDLKKYLKQTGDGIYVVGLDNHVGFITVKGEEMRFVHSNYYQVEIGVMAQKLNSEHPLSNSDYRVVGKLFSDEMIIWWLTFQHME